MSLSLQVKKFINSEHTGRYVEITLPHELFAEPKNSRKQDEEDSPEEAAPQFETTRIHYVEEGVGEPLILVHTVGQSLYTWRTVVPQLSEHYRVIAVDLAGHGYSDRPISLSYNIFDHADVLRLFMGAIGVQSAHFLAFSMGASYVAQLAIDHPERVGKLIFIAPGGVTPEMPLAIRLIDSTVFGGIASLLYTRSTVQKILENAFFDLTFVKDDMIQEYYKPASDPEGRRCIRASLHSFDEQPILPRLREVQCPVLILHGSEDKWHKAQEVDLFHAAIRGAGFSVIRNVGHLLHEEKPDRLIAAILEFIPVIMPGG